MASSSSPLLSLADVHKRFGSVVALNGASVRLYPGEVRALVGGNGSGKSTLAKVMLGIVEPDRVTVAVHGQEQSTHHGLRAGHGPHGLRIAATFQEVSLLDDLSVEENILLAGLPRRLGIVSAPRRARSVTGEAVERVALPRSVLSKKVRDLPLDQRALAELAKVLLSDPQVLIMDELTASLRAEQVEHVGALLRDLSSQGVSTLFVSHRLEELEEFCTSCTVLRNGATVLETDKITDYSMGDYVAAMTAVAGQSGAFRTRRRSETRSSGAVLKVEGLTLSPWEERVDLVANAGEIIGLGGLAGNGQSEMLRAVFGSLPAHVDRIEVDGGEVRRQSIHSAIARGLGFLSGEREREMAFGQRTIDENLMVVARRLKRRFSSRTLMDRMKLVGQPRQPMRSLSGGNQQKVIIGPWLELQPKVLLADDPTRGVDVATRQEIHRLLRELADAGSAVVLTSSDDRELAEICDRVYIVYRGRVRTELRGDEVTEEEIARVSVHPEYQERSA